MGIHLKRRAGKALLKNLLPLLPFRAGQAHSHMSQSRDHDKKDDARFAALDFNFCLVLFQIKVIEYRQSISCVSPAKKRSGAQEE